MLLPSIAFGRLKVRSFVVQLCLILIWCQVWLSSAETLDLNANAVPFLPVDSSLSPTRNQGRQKLGRFTTPELKGLVYDILADAQRRQQSSADKG